MEAGGVPRDDAFLWSLPGCLWRLKGPRVDAGPVVTAVVSMEAGGASS